MIDWDGQQATCPQGRTSQHWKLGKDGDGHDVAIIRFAASDCRACPVRIHCVRSDRERSLTIRTQRHYEALQAARVRHATPAFRAAYARRAGIEGTISQGTRRSDLRRSRYIGLAKTRLLHVLIGASLNFIRVAAWLAEVPHAQTRRSAFTMLAGVPT